MIEIEIATIENLPAILAGILVALEHIVTRKFHFLLGKSIEDEKHNHPRDTDPKGDCRDQFMVRRVRGQIAPTLEIMRHEIVRLIGRHNVCVSSINERECTTSGADIHRLPEPVEYQNLTV